MQHRFAGIILSIAFQQTLVHHSTPFRRRYESPLSTNKLACTANVRVTIRLLTSHHQQHEKYKSTNYGTQAVRSTFIFCQYFQEKEHPRFPPPDVLPRRFRASVLSVLLRGHWGVS